MDTALASMPPKLTPAQHKTYETLRLRVYGLLTEYDGFRQHTLAESIGTSQALVSSVLRGRMVSIPVLERLARVMMLQMSQSDRRTLRAELESALKLLRHRAGPPGRKP